MGLSGEDSLVRRKSAVLALVIGANKNFRGTMSSSAAMKSDE